MWPEHTVRDLGRDLPHAPMAWLKEAGFGHFGFAEDIVNKPQGPWCKRWTERLASGEIAGNAWTEIGDAKIEGF